MTDQTQVEVEFGFRTYSGHLIDLEKGPTPEQVNIEDIAHHLAFQNRFGGAANRQYSIAEHCIYVAQLTSMKMFGCYYLMHDAAEAYLQDLHNPLKRFIRKHTSAYDDLSDKYDKIILTKLGLSYEKYKNLHDEIKKADLFVYSLERKRLFYNQSLGVPADHPLYKAPFGMPAEEAEALFLQAFKELAE